jgi:hypothetical protein
VSQNHCEELQKQSPTTVIKNNVVKFHGKKDQTIFNQTTNKKNYNDQIKSKNIMNEGEKKHSVIALKKKYDFIKKWNFNGIQ